MNKVVLCGNLGKDPELRYTTDGKPVATFSLATNEKWTKDGVEQTKTEWHNIVVWNKLAENCNKYLKKGRMALIEGKIQTRSWDSDDGVKHYRTEVVAISVQFIGGQAPKDNAPHPAEADNAPAGPMPTAPAPTEEDLPF